MPLRPVAAAVSFIALAAIAAPSAWAQHMMQQIGEEEVMVDADLRTTAVTEQTRAPRSDGDRVVMDAAASAEEISDAGREAQVFFEPRGLLGLIRERSDLVLLMRHGRTDWSFLDVDAVDPEDCSGQRVMTVQGREDMRSLGYNLARGAIVPSRIVSSRWCRNQDTTRNFIAGQNAHSNAQLRDTELVWNNEANLLLSSNGAATVTALREMIADWNARQDSETDEEPLPGPLLIVSHFTNIAELTEFNVYEGEMLVLDPDRNNRVLGYLRLSDAGPDVGHFDPSVTGASVEETVAGVGAPTASSTTNMPTDEGGLDTADTDNAQLAVTVVGPDGDGMLLEDSTGRPLRMNAEELADLLRHQRLTPSNETSVN